MRRFSSVLRLSAVASAASLQLAASLAQAAPAPDFLEQGWDQATREAAYYTPQGSRLIPHQWFLALERPDGQGKFADATYLSRFGLLFDGPSARNPDGLPVGFTKDPDPLPETGQWLGLTCAACHTGEIRSGAKTIRIDGAPTQADIDAFLGDLALAVSLTRTSNLIAGDLAKDRFRRFATAVLGPSPPEEGIEKLSASFERFAVEFEGDVTIRRPPVPSGAGRIDAIGQIINVLSVSALKEPDNLRPSSAPVSYPFLWLTPKLDFVQWAPVAGIPIARNAGEVLGVFADLDFTHPTAPLKSSLRLRQLHELEQWSEQLQPPVWPAAVLGNIDAARSRQGKTLFDRDCKGCHNMPPYRMSPPDINLFGKSFIQVRPISIGVVQTDPTYTANLLSRSVKTGPLASRVKGKEVVSALHFFLASVGETTKQAFTDQNIPEADLPAYNGFRLCSANVDETYCGKGQGPGQPWTPPDSASHSLKAGPLFGIWATAPFLHNGSVPNLYEMLSPPQERSSTFWVGQIEFDSERVGFRSGPATEAPPTGGSLFRFDTRLPGNSNRGHQFPARGYTHEERLAVIEYLKDPGDWR